MSDDLTGKIIDGYEILKLIGQGGMASVYLAQQKSMNRNVAFKVLPQQYLNDTTYLQRFEQEVNIVSKLEHRNIVPVYHYGETDGRPYIVMRYMPAGSVDDLIAQGPLDPQKILDIVTQIAPALDYAHSQQVLHRDLKPSNVLLDNEGGAFLTDFGIARVIGQQGPGITTQGVVGTPSYMSPEQAQAHPLDGRSDIYALGVMLFEMATGRRPFESDTPYSIAVMQVTQAPPSPRAINANVSVAMEGVILRALNKNPDDRFTTVAELASVLKQAIENPGSLHDTQPKSPFSAPPVVHQASPPTSESRVSVPPVSSGYIQQPPRRYIKRPKRGSGSGVWLSVLLGGIIGCGLLTVVVALIAMAVGLLDPNIILNSLSSTQPSTPLNIIQVETTTPEATTPRTTTTPFNIPTLDATSRAAQQTLVPINTALAATSAAEITIVPTATKGVQPVGVREGTPVLNTPLRAAEGEIIYFDTRQTEFQGETFRTTEIVRVNLDTWVETQLTSDTSTNSYPVASPDGEWVAFQSNRDGDFEIYVMTINGGQLKQLTNNDHYDRLPAWSPDGEWIIYSSDVRNDGTFDLYRISHDGNDGQLVFSNGQRNSHPRYSPDGRYLVFTTGADIQDARTWEIAILDLITAELRLLTDNDYRDASPVFNPEGTRILFSRFNDGDNDIVEMNVDGSDLRVLYSAASNDWTANYSPDGEYIVFWSTIEDDEQVFLMKADGTGAQQITTTGGAYPSWVPDR